MQPFVSVIIPVYNVEKYLERCLDSVCRQTLKNIEIILVDDGSPDRCPSICDSYARADPRVTVIHKKNGGVSSARNAGLESASGQYVSFVDSDDMINDNMLEQLYKAISENCSDLSFCLYEEIDENTDDLSENDKPFEYIRMDTKAAFDNFTDYRKLVEVTVWNKMYKKDLISGLSFDTEKRSAEDFEFLMRYLLRCRSAVMVNAPLYGYYVQRAGAAQSKKDNDINFYVIQNENAYKIAEEVIRNQPTWKNDMIGFAVANSTISLANAIVRMGLYKSEKVRDIKNCYRKNLKYILRSKLIFSKKLQVLVFLVNARLYGAMLKTRKRK